MGEQNTSKDRKWREITVDDSEVWNKPAPEVGATLEGEFVKTEENIGPKKSKLHVIKTGKGEVKAWGSTVLNDKLLGVPTGAYVKIEYGGMKQSKMGQDYHDYKVFVDDGSLDADMPKDFLEG